MTKKILLATGISILITITCLLLFILLNKVTYDGEITIDNPSKEQMLFLSAPGKKSISGIYLNISGNLDADSSLNFILEGKPVYTIELNAGEINKSIDTDWYANKCDIKYSPKKVTKGNLVIKYIFG